MRWISVVSLLWLLCGAGLAGAQTDSTATRSKRSRLFPPRLASRGYVVLPKLYYSSETSLGVGGELLRPFRLDDDRSLESEIALRGRYTLKNQALLELRSDLFWGHGDWSLTAKLGYDALALRFWGVGPDTPAEDEEVYRPQRLLAYVELSRVVFEELRLGVRLETENFQLLDRKPQGILDVSPPRGARNSTVTGAGLLFVRDTREPRRSPHRGALIQGFALWFDEEFGSEFDFNNYNFEYRRYYSVRGNHVLATQLFLYSARGAPPFWRLAALGGRHHTRGYRKARYLDHILMAFQLEYRTPFWWRVGSVAFAGLGDVADEFHAFQLETMRPTVGGGLRAKITQREDILLRADVAVGQGSLRFYFSLGQAF
jgi:hypothetical protein